MPNSAVADLIGRELGQLPHPDPQAPIVKVAGYSTAGKPPQLVAQLAPQATRVGEGIVHLIETNGYEIVPRHELATLREAAAIGQTRPVPIAHVYCHCGTEMQQINISTPERVIANGAALIKALAGRRPECPHEPVAAP